VRDQTASSAGTALGKGESESTLSDAKKRRPRPRPRTPVPSIDGNLLFDLSPLPLTILTPSCSIARVSDRFLFDWQVSRDACVGQQLVAFLDKFLRPASTAAIVYLTAAIDDFVSSRAERTSKPRTTKHASSWRARVLPIFKEAELLAIVLE
jgi:osomolarity two-component system, sensor histidine kinase TcsA